MSIRLKFTAALAAAWCLAIAGLGLASFKQQEGILRQELEERAQAAASRLAGASQARILGRDRAGLRTAVRALRKTPDILHAAVLDDGGQVLAGMPGSPDGEPALDAEQPITAGPAGTGRRLGTARVGISRQALDVGIRRQKHSAIFLTSCFALLGLAFAMLLGNMLTRRLESQLQEMMRMEKYISRSTLQLIRRVSDIEQFKLGGERRYIVVLFSDIRGFTAITETAPPEEVVRFLNIYLNLQAEAISQRGGAVDKFVGDEVMAIFTGADAELNAARAAVEIQCFVSSLNACRQRTGKRPVQVGIGINSGEVIMGNMGSQRQMDYTVIGDPVNTAARLCSMAGPGEVIISRAVHAALEDECTADHLPPIDLKGKKDRLDIYKLRAMEHTAREYLRRTVAVKAAYAPAATPDALHPAVIRNISLGGCSIEADKPLDIGAQVMLTADSRALDRLRSQPAAVRFSRISGSRFQIGLAFRDPPPATRDQLAEFVYAVGDESDAA